MKRYYYLIFCVLITHLAAAQRANRFVNYTEFGGLFGRVRYENIYTAEGEQVENKTSITIQTFNGMQVGRRAALGVTAGMDWYKAALITPIAAGMRYDLAGRKNVRLFGILDAGYGFTWFHQDLEGFDTKGGAMLNPGIGLRIGKMEKAAFTMALAYKRQYAHVDKPVLSGQISRSEERIYNRLAIRLGFSF
jgi:hypothetical protein